MILHCIGGLNGYIAYFASLQRRGGPAWGSQRDPPKRGLVVGSRPLCFVCYHCTYSGIPICGIIIENKYYQMQSERVLCICAGAKRRRSVKLNTNLSPDNRGAETEAGEPISLSGLLLASGNTRLKGQGRKERPLPHVLELNKSMFITNT